MDLIFVYKEMKADLSSSDLFYGIKSKVWFIAKTKYLTFPFQYFQSNLYVSTQLFESMVYGKFLGLQWLGFWHTVKCEPLYIQVYAFWVQLIPWDVSSYEKLNTLDHS